MSAPKPTALKVMEGTYRPDRANPAEPQPAIGASAPPWLPRSGPARAAWRRLRRQLLATRVLTRSDCEALALGCMALTEYLEARADATSWRRADAAWKRYAAVLRDFGMNPSARTRVAAVPVAERDPLEEWLASNPSPPPAAPPPPRKPRTQPTTPPADALAAWLGGTVPEEPA